jgi:hypothetical protein
MAENTDVRDLDYISLFHYIAGGIMALFACIPLIHFFLGIAMVCGSLNDSGGQAPPEWFGLIFAIMGGIFFIFGQTIAWATIYSGRQIKKRRKYMFSFILACIMCMFVPIGTVLGVFSIIILSRPSVKELYQIST